MHHPQGGLSGDQNARVSHKNVECASLECAVRRVQCAVRRVQYLEGVQ